MPHKLNGVRLRATSIPGLQDFYTRHLGMRAWQDGDATCVGYGGEGAHIEFHQAENESPYRHDRGDEYWKIGITLPNIDIAYDQLRASKIDVGKPQQFMDVGYLCHLTDPAGFQIELLQHTFEDEPRTAPGDASLPLGGGAQIGQITLRSTNIAATREEYETRLGMRLLSIQAVEQYGFTLYFFGLCDESPPTTDLAAVANRPWVYQRPYTTLEIQHLADHEGGLNRRAAGASGYEGLAIG